MTKLRYNDQAYNLDRDENLLDCLLRHGVDIPYSCKSGTCQSCLVQAEKGSIPEKAQVGLKSTLKQLNMFLACQCHPVEDMVLRGADDAGVNVVASIEEMTFLAEDVVRVILMPSSPLRARPGQYVTLVNPDLISRSYSVANDPSYAGIVELQIRLLQNGKMSEWLKSDAQLGMNVILRGPAGDCFYPEGLDQECPIILAGTGTGLAPLYGILQDALRQGHRGAITLVHGASEANGLYLTDELRKLESENHDFTYTPVVVQGEQSGGLVVGDIKEVVLSSLPEDTSNVHVFLCGAPETVNTLKTQAFLAGVPSKQIFSDPFILSTD